MKEYLKKLVSLLFLIYKNHRENKYLYFVLNIASYFYFLAYKARLLLYKLKIINTKQLSAVVISIGNITVGGTGKTPLTIEVAKYLSNKGYKVAVLSRGYKRIIAKNINNDVVLVSDGHDILTTHDISGDEPYLIAKKVPKAIVLVGKNRIKIGEAAIRLGAEILILDDGFQYLRLSRNENILLLDGYTGFNNGFSLPKGNLRELPESTKRATAIVLSNINESELKEYDVKKLKIYAQNKPIVTMKYEINQFIALNVIKRMSIEEAREVKIIAFSGIANPKSFLDSLKQCNINVLHYLTFEDHHNYNNEELQHIIKCAYEKDVEDIITTEKDAIKIQELCQASPKTFWRAELSVIINSKAQIENLFTNKNSWTTKK